ncbi:MAG: SDR family oxidoreductase [Candidatus Binataceae bacterium]
MGSANGRKSIFITGAASGMGREAAKLFQSKEWFVGGYDLNLDGLNTLEIELGGANCVIRRLDVTDKPDYERAIAEFGTATNGHMDMLYNNAGIGAGGLFDQVPFAESLRVVQVNFIGVLNGIHSAIGLLKATPGSLCFTTSSSSATYGMPGIAVYSATKHAVKGLTEALAVEFRRYGVRAADVLPGLIDTPLVPRPVIERASKEGLFRPIPALEVAKVAWEAYHSDRLHWYVPPELVELDKAATNTPELVREQFATASPLEMLNELIGRPAKSGG